MKIAILILALYKFYNHHYSLNFERQVAISQPEIHFAIRTQELKILFAVEIPQPLLKEWYKIINEQASDSEGTSSQILQLEVNLNKLLARLKMTICESSGVLCT